MDVYLHNNTWNPHTHDLYSSHWNCIWHEICVIMTKWPLSLSRAIEFFEREEHQNELFFLISWIILSTAHWKWKFIAFSSSSQCNRYERSHHQQHAGMSSVYVWFSVVRCENWWKTQNHVLLLMKICVCIAMHSNAHTTPQLKTKIFRKLNFHVCMPQKRALWKSLKFNMWADYLMKFTINTKSDLRFGFFL